MQNISTKAKSIRKGLALFAIFLVVVALLGLWQAERGVESIRLEVDGLPLTILTPSDAAGNSRPLVLIGHGLAGSNEVMRGFALTLAHAGYTVASWDFAGHGGNTNHWDQALLLNDPERALEAVAARRLADTDRVAILGHSMGSGVAIDFGQIHPVTMATVAVSPVVRKVTLELPHNLLLMAGSLEAPFVSNAESILAQAGGVGGDPSQGTARDLQVIMGVEHVTILFAPGAHETARVWFDSVFGPQPGGKIYRDWRILWYGLGVLGGLLLAVAFAPLLASPDSTATAVTASRRWLISMAGGAFGATLALWLASMVGLSVRTLLGLVVGGYLLLWFALAGLFACLFSGIRPNRPSRRAVTGGLLAFAALWLGVGLLGHFVWLHWLLVRPRLLLWPLGVLLLLPWFLVVGQASAKEGLLGQVVWWLAHSAILIVALSLAQMLDPDLSFLLLILPIFPLVLGVHALTAGAQRNGWAFALSAAMFVSWMILSIFPLL